jgi:hypothetical protein
MEYGRRPHDEGAPSSRLPWWMGRRVRLTVLLLALAVTALALTGARRSLFAGATASAGTMCTRPALPSVMNIPLDRLLELRAGLLPVVSGIGRHRAPGGTVTPESIRLGLPPQMLALPRSPGRLWPGGYEMRRRAKDGEYVAADALLFASAHDAQDYVELTARAPCRFRPLEVKPSSGPPQTRNLVSLDFATFTTYTALLRRGPQVYRITEVHPQPNARRPSIFQLGPGITRVNALACRLADAHCPAAGHAPAGRSGRGEVMQELREGAG